VIRFWLRVKLGEFHEVFANLRLWKHLGFGVDQSLRLETGDLAGIQRLIPYFLRCPFSPGAHD